MKTIMSQNGIALLTVLLATALMAVLAVGVTTEQQIGVRRTENLFEGDQAMLLASGIEEWAVQILTRDQNRQGPGYDHLGEDWAMGLLPTPVGNGIVAGRIEDLQGRINVNSLVDVNDTADPVTQRRIENLYTLCGMDTSMVDALIDWIDRNIIPEPNGAEDDDYLLNDIPYRSGNRKMASTTELLLVAGMTREGFQCLQPNVSALPGTTDINVNTAGAMVIASLSSRLSLADAKEVVEDRPENGYADITDFTDDRRISGSGVNSVGLGLESDYFQLTGQAVFGRSEVLLYSGLVRDPPPVRVFSHSIGAY